MKTIYPTTNEITLLINEIDKIIQTFLDYQGSASTGRYESEVTSRINIFQAIRLLEGITELARNDLVLIQGALVMSRSLFEVLTRTAWILHPEDIMEQEARYLAFLDTEIQYYMKLIKKFNSDPVKRRIEQTRQFRDSLSKLITEQGYAIPVMPNMRDMLKSMDEERKYLYYMTLSQYTHFSHYASGLYQTNLGTSKIITETNSIDKWKLVFAISIPAFFFTTDLFSIATGNKKPLWTEDYKNGINQLIKEVN